jgi:hypothetical protein
MALLAALLASCVLLVASNRQPPHLNTAVPRTAPESAAPIPVTASATLPAPVPVSASVPLSAPVPVSAPAAQAAQAPQMPPAPPPAASAPKTQADTLSIAARSYRIGARNNFAEIHIRRSGGSDADTSFAWWTEPSSAMPGIDYIPQARTVQMISKRRQTATLFVKLVPDATRKQSAVFYVVIGEPGNGTSLGRITRAAVFLPSK